MSPEEWEELNARLRDAEEKLRAFQAAAANPPATVRPGNEFLATLAHELRDPLAPIRNAVEIMRLTGPKDAALSTALDLISRQVDQLSRRVDGLIDMSQKHQSRISLGKKPAGVNETPRRIVVIDDNQDTAQSLAMVLRLHGHDVETAFDGASGLALALESAPDCVLVDIGLPGLDGYEVAKRLRSHDRDRRTLLIALTGYGQEEDHSRSRQAGFDHHLVKPVAQNVLEDLLRER